jgi:glyoxylase-like metal-dependent hydrolase (beta-lactamase superfamily II)
MTLDRRAFLQISAAGLCAAALPGQTHAKIPRQNQQVPAYYRQAVGAFEVIALNDGVLELSPSLYPAADQAEARQLLQNAHRLREGMLTAVNAYAINTGDALVLVDTGTASAMGPTLGKLLANLAAAGIEPAMVDTIFITHLHPDHANGLVDAQGRAVFPNAELVLAEKEYAFWHDEGMMSQAPAEAKPFFQAARSAVKPYDSRIRKITEGEIAPGLTALLAPGHTPGHSMLRVVSGKDALLIWGDIVHTAALQFHRPEWAISFDTDMNEAVTTRRKVFDQVTADQMMIAGMHLDFPGIGHLSRTKEGYDYHPAFWSPTL